MAYVQINIRDIDLNAITFALPNYSPLANTNVKIASENFIEWE